MPGYRDPKDLDIAEAKSLMAEAGFPDGFKADMNSGSSSQGLLVAELVTEQLRASLGIDLSLKPVDTGLLTTCISRRAPTPSLWSAAWDC